ncbi:GlxA family transcriptional regulator [Actinocatenispora rupis]|uniref:Transcriptional regulator n=1 Tax=Actinocatenispora rupis TaxID=519421 RepID=A0A8J3J3N6_9ACTN|nr:helix-turn-helix domain-containing protein [Actinocatenispora rupis]GID09549.1 transcriptional regulator [Actinocatenispora rupis]
MAAHVVAVLALDQVVGMDMTIPSQIFGPARGPDGAHLYDVRICTADGGPVRSAARFTLLPDHDLSAVAAADTVIVPGMYQRDAYERGTLAAPVRDALTAAYGRGARLMSICTGAFALAATGLLDGRPAATHWRSVDRFRALYPKVRLDPDVLFVDDGDVLTSAGVAAGLDLCLHVLRRDHGTELANHIARRAVVPAWRPGGQSQFIERPMPERVEASTAPTRQWALAHLDRPLGLDELAAHSRMSVRTFTRRFREETGMSPNRWVTRQRVEAARHLLEASDLSVEQIARRCGFGTAVSLRQHLRTALGVSPGAYRRTFRPPVPS